MVAFTAAKPIMGYEWRYLFPLTPLWFAACAAALPSLLERLPSGRTLVGALAIVAVAALLFWRWPRSEWSQLYSSGLQAAHRELGAALGRIGEQYPRLAIGDAGAVPYFSDWHTLDTFGLNDRYIATTRQHPAEYVFKDGADVLVLISSSAEKLEPHLAWEQGLYQHAIDRGMVLARQYKFGQNYYLWVLGDARLAAALK